MTTWLITTPRPIVWSFATSVRWGRPNPRGVRLVEGCSTPTSAYPWCCSADSSLGVGIAGSCGLAASAGFPGVATAGVSCSSWRQTAVAHRRAALQPGPWAAGSSSDNPDAAVGFADSDPPWCPGWDHRCPLDQPTMTRTVNFCRGVGSSGV